ncbi:MAG TPA: hypothetical protein VH643_04210 [Gemmataceae bacterium]|jgi:hypothetical protein
MSKEHDVLQRALASVPAEREHRNNPTATVATIGAPDNRLWYCTPDRVNLTHAEQLAAPFGLTLEHHEPRDGAVPGYAILIDADFWWSGLADLQRGLDNLLAREDRCIVAVHGWHLDDDLIARLIAGGIHASNRLDRDLMALIAGDLASLPPCKPVPISIS